MIKGMYNKKMPMSQDKNEAASFLLDHNLTHICYQIYHINGR